VDAEWKDGEVEEGERAEEEEGFARRTVEHRHHRPRRRTRGAEGAGEATENEDDGLERGSSGEGADEGDDEEEDEEVIEGEETFDDDLFATGEMQKVPFL